MHETFRFAIGDVTCLAINDGESAGGPDMLFANAPAASLAQALERHEEKSEKLLTTWTCLLIDTGRHTVLVDTGGGYMLSENGGRLLPALQAQGFAAGEIDVVLLTHGHIDHIGGCLDGEGRSAYSKARYIMWQTELEYWTSETLLVDMPQWMSQPARQLFPTLASQIETVSVETEVVPGVGVLPAPGHTVGHMAVQVESRDARLLHIADAALHPIHLEHPEWIARVDQDAERTQSTRRALFARAVSEKSLVLAYHFWPSPGLGHIIESGDAWQWVPLAAAS